MVDNRDKPGYSEGIFTFMTTEHFTLQSARSIINQEITSRLSSYFMTLSSVLIASAFLAQLPENHTLFVLFTIIAFPILLFLGEMSLIRIMKLGLMDSIYIRAINRVRHFYIEAAPESEKYFLFPPYDDPVSISQYAGYRFTAKGNLTSIGAIIGLVNTFITTILIGIVLDTTFHMPIQQIIPIGLVLIILLFPMQGYFAYRINQNDIFEKHLETHFPIAQYKVEPESDK